jgi:hypothetical protein
MFNRYITDEDYINAREKYIDENFNYLLESFAIKKGCTINEPQIIFSLSAEEWIEFIQQKWLDFIEQKWIEYNDDLESKDLNTIDYFKIIEDD